MIRDERSQWKSVSPPRLKKTRPQWYTLFYRYDIMPFDELPPQNTLMLRICSRLQKLARYFTNFQQAVSPRFYHYIESRHHRWLIFTRLMPFPRLVLMALLTWIMQYQNILFFPSSLRMKRQIFAIHFYCLSCIYKAIIIRAFEAFCRYCLALDDGQHR